ncbi:MAG: hypothetical protein JWL76_2067 [Thermoleophilia bacterium]|nr:hypothetical protein [Thermoleophilia bacterium]
MSITTMIRSTSLTLVASLAMVVAAAALPAAALAAESGAAPASGLHTYTVTITNLTKGQPLSPPLISTNYGSGQFFKPGGTANWGVQQIAENGNNTPLYDSTVLDMKAGYVTDVQRASAPLVPAGSPADAMFDQSVTLTIRAKDTDRINWISMLGCSNDGFAGFNAARLPRAKGRSVNVPVLDFDAGTEENTEDFADLGAACQGAIGVKSTQGALGTSMTDWRLAEGGTIHRHEGIFGASDDGLLEDVHGWNPRKIAKVSIKRID